MFAIGQRVALRQDVYASGVLLAAGTTGAIRSMASHIGNCYWTVDLSTYGVVNFHQNELRIVEEVQALDGNGDRLLDDAYNKIRVARTRLLDARTRFTDEHRRVNLLVLDALLDRAEHLLQQMTGTS